MSLPSIPKWLGEPLVVLLVLSAVSCGMGRDSSDYRSFVASHDAIRPGMTIRQAFEAHLVDYLFTRGGNMSGSTVPAKEPVSSECRRRVFDVHYGSGDLSTSAGFSVRVYCNMNGPSDRQVAPQGLFHTKGGFLEGLEAYSSWTHSMSFRIESPSLKIGGVFDSYNFSTDDTGKIATVSAIWKSSN